MPATKCCYWMLMYLCTVFTTRQTIASNTTFPILYKGSCPSQCYCQIIRRTINTNYLMYDTSNSLQKESLLKTLCSNKQLTVFPGDVSYETNILFLDYNHLTRLNRSMFYGIDQVMHLSFAHNYIASIANDTFYDLPYLETLDLNHNYLKYLPEGTLCPWLPTSAYHSSYNKSPQCSSVMAAQTKLSLRMQYNKWHCNCNMQRFLEAYACAYDDTCVTFIKNRDGNIGHCASPVTMKNVALESLSSGENAADSVNACAYRKTHIDIPLLVTLLTWIGAVLGYVIYFIAWNNKDVANHRTYLTKLDSRSPYQSYRGSSRSVLDTPRSRSRTSTLVSHNVLDVTANKVPRSPRMQREATKAPSSPVSLALASQLARSASPRTGRVAFRSTISPLIEEATIVPEKSTTPVAFDQIPLNQAKNEYVHCSSV